MIGELYTGVCEECNGVADIDLRVYLAKGQVRAYELCGDCIKKFNKLGYIDLTGDNKKEEFYE